MISISVGLYCDQQAVCRNLHVEARCSQSDDHEQLCGRIGRPLLPLVATKQSDRQDEQSDNGKAYMQSSKFLTISNCVVDTFSILLTTQTLKIPIRNLS